ARIDLGGHLERDTRRDVGLDEPGNHVHRRPLRGEHQVDPGGACLLRQPCDQLFHRSEEHTSELQSPCNLVCRLLLEKKKTYKPILRSVEAYSSLERRVSFVMHSTCFPPACSLSILSFATASCTSPTPTTLSR